MRTARHLLLLSLSLSLLTLATHSQSPSGPFAAVAQLLGAAPQAGYIAEGQATVTGPAGSSQGVITVWVWGAAHRRTRIVFPTFAGYETVVNGTHAWSRGAPAIVALPPPSPYRGLALLPQGLPFAAAGAALAAVDLGATPPLAGAAAGHRWGLARVPAAALQSSPASKLPLATWLDLDGTSGLPTRAGYAVHGHQIEIRYSQYESSPVPSPRHVELWRDGSVLLRADFQRVALHAGFTDKDFPASSPLRSGKEQQ